MVPLEHLPATKADVELVISKLESLEHEFKKIALKEKHREYYTISEAAKLTGFKPFTLRQACNLKRINASKMGKSWRISRDVIMQIQENGLPKVNAINAS